MPSSNVGIFLRELHFMEILCGNKAITSKNNSIFACKCGAPVDRGLSWVDTLKLHVF